MFLYLYIRCVIMIIYIINTKAIITTVVIITDFTNILFLILTHHVITNTYHLINSCHVVKWLLTCWHVGFNMYITFCIYFASAELIAILM